MLISFNTYLNLIWRLKRQLFHKNWISVIPRSNLESNKLWSYTSNYDFLLVDSHSQVFCCKYCKIFNPLSANFTKWSNTLKQFVCKLLTNILSVFDHFVGLAFKGLIKSYFFADMLHLCFPYVCFSRTFVRIFRRYLIQKSSAPNGLAQLQNSWSETYLYAY